MSLQLGYFSLFFPIWRSFAIWKWLELHPKNRMFKSGTDPVHLVHSDEATLSEGLKQLYHHMDSCVSFRLQDHHYSLSNNTSTTLVFSTIGYYDTAVE